MIDVSRLHRDLDALAEFGRTETGITRLSFSKPDLQARIWLRDRMAEAGLDASIDRMGNVYGRSSQPTAILIGSHSDTVVEGGRLDGSLGVIYAIEIARQMRQLDLPVGIDIVSFVDEEGTYLSWLGSRYFCGEIDAAAIENARDQDGLPLTAALLNFAEMAAEQCLGLKEPFQLDKVRIRAFLEAHIEQGPRLEASGIPIGIVTSIVGIRNREVHFFGRADHAGTTPMNMRRDAGAALLRFASLLEDRFRSISGPDTVWNFGHVKFCPGRRTIVPNEAHISVQFRSSDKDVLAELDSLLDQTLDEVARDRNVEATVVRGFGSDPVRLDKDLGFLIADAAARLDVRTMLMPSGAGHDSAALARHVPVAMMFVPSIGGRSHSSAEATLEEDIEEGCRVLQAAVVRLAQGDAAP